MTLAAVALLDCDGTISTGDRPDESVREARHRFERVARE